MQNLFARGQCGNSLPSVFLLNAENLNMCYLNMGYYKPITDAGNFGHCPSTV